uniref:Disease resistance R13L4/SHOC-2-like LRR domain-containing protein n=1 Tax=Anopheles atroparvus TaxID=41427 RepID=A0A182IWW8_ANOAO
MDGGGGYRNVMHLSYRDYRSVPEEELRGEGNDEIEEIYLKENLIRHFPDWFFVEMGHLRFLCLAGNVIDTLPPQIGRLVCLETLDLSDNSLQCLPPSLGQLGRLSRLLLNGNLLTQLPPELGRLQRLEVLELRKNRLTGVPLELGQCGALQDLILDDNPGLVSIPTCLFNLPRLCYVSAERCNLFQLPFAINTTTLQFLRLFGGNHSLTHCPLALERHAQPDYDALADRVRRIRNPPCYRKVQCLPVPYMLNFPAELLTLKDHRSEGLHPPETLLETALRACAGYGFWAEELAKINLPKTLSDRLLYGPVACCSSVPCGKTLFTEAVLVLVKRKEYARNFLLSALFCSKLCADRWLQYSCDTYEELAWRLPPVYSRD